SIRYVVANPSSYLYLDKTRYQFREAEKIVKTSDEIYQDCPCFNDYKYGLDNLYGYSEHLTPQVIRNRLLSRPILFVLGTADTDRDFGLNKSCEGDAQGNNRYERGLLYRHHLKAFMDNDTNFRHTWLEIHGVDHDAGDIYTHPDFINKLKNLYF
ncbi:MAG: hypothetical protein GY699_20430, partial [Desulfobacteraceae bacterium]|nr:hypothetical protein [Desulfobacteraceae bacterium]